MVCCLTLFITHSCALIEVPVIAILTKIDALEDKIQGQLFWDLQDEGMSASEAMAEAESQAASRVNAKLDEYYVRRLETVDHPPKEIVRLRGKPFL